ncbi:MAG: hypothetical protein JXJ04_20445 [Spirochaetales bacterium]|nr:hypothetical protein [Spirochaetales bacterium]
MNRSHLIMVYATKKGLNRPAPNTVTRLRIKKSSAVKLTNKQTAKTDYSAS